MPAYLTHGHPMDRMQPSGLPCMWDFPGRAPGAGSHPLLQGIFLTRGSILRLLQWQADSWPPRHLGSPVRLEGEARRAVCPAFSTLEPGFLCSCERQGRAYRLHFHGVCILIYKSIHCVLIFMFSSVQLLSRVRLFATPWTAARQASLSITNSRSPPKLTSVESVMPSTISSYFHVDLLTNKCLVSEPTKTDSLVTQEHVSCPQPCLLTGIWGRAPSPG